RAAHTNASAIPVLPLVASTIVVRPGSIRPSASAAAIIATPMRSLTLPPGLNDSSFAYSSTSSPGSRRVRRTIGVPPIRSALLIGICPIGGSRYGQEPPHAVGQRADAPATEAVEKRRELRPAGVREPRLGPQLRQQRVEWGRVAALVEH